MYPTEEKITTITATTLNIAAVDNFYNRGNVTADNFNISSN